MCSQYSLFLISCRPLPLSIGFIAQYVLKPALGVFIATAFGVPRMFYAGFVLSACVAGAQLSSYASFLSKGDVALSILLTSSTTIASVIVTPLLTGLLIGSVVPVDAVAMAKSILQVMGSWDAFVILDIHFIYIHCFSDKKKCFGFNIIDIVIWWLGCACSSHYWPCTEYLCQTSCHHPSTSDAICCYDLYFIVHRQSSCN